VDVNVANTLSVQGGTTRGIGGVQFGSGGPYLTGNASTGKLSFSNGQFSLGQFANWSMAVSNGVDADLLFFVTATGAGDKYSAIWPSTSTRLALGTNQTERVSIYNAGYLFVKDATAPGSNPSGGGYLYVESGALKYRGSSGTISTIANA
jgi:hypothetical protein